MSFVRKLTSLYKTIQGSQAYFLWETGLLSLLKFDLERLGLRRPWVPDSDSLTGKRTESELQAAFVLKHA